MASTRKPLRYDSVELYFKCPKESPEAPLGSILGKSQDLLFHIPKRLLRSYCVDNAAPGSAQAEGRSCDDLRVNLSWIVSLQGPISRKLSKL